MATHSSVLAWRIPGRGEPGGLPSIGLHRVSHDWSDLAAAAAVLSIWSKIMFCMILILLNLLRIVLWLMIWFIWVNVPVCVCVCVCVLIVYSSVRTRVFYIHVWIRYGYCEIFYQFPGGVLQSPVRSMDLSFYSFSSISFCFICLETLCLNRAHYVLLVHWTTLTDITTPAFFLNSILHAIFISILYFNLLV